MRIAQLRDWELARGNYVDLADVKTTKLDINGIMMKVQFNPKRITSSAAKVDAKSIQERKCFLCKSNLPEQQKGVDFGGGYLVLVNPFPIFPRHLTIPSYMHEPQRIEGKLTDMLELAYQLPDYVVFYNGPKCGASAPDHFHFQAGNKGFLPLEINFDLLKRENILSAGDVRIDLLPDYPCTVLVIESKEASPINTYFEKVYHALEIKPGEYEPMMNILAWHGKGNFKLCIFPRALHRPSCFFEEGENNRLISPASVDMGGVFITPLEKDFEAMNSEDVKKIIQEVCMDKDSLQKIADQLKA
jgi:galactose-1-phosphate uridylyltransferase